MRLSRIVGIISFFLPWVLAGGALFVLCAIRFPSNGVFRVSSVLDGRSAWINPFLPGERTSQPGVQPEGWIGQRITDDPTYFTARVPGPYERVDVSLEFRPVHQPFLEFGLVRDAAGNDLDLQPLFSESLESSNWKRVETADVTGFIRTGNRDSRLHAESADGLAVWDATTTYPVLQDPVGEERVTSVSLRGSHDFYVVPAGGEVRMTFGVQAANRTEGSDNAVFRVFRGDEEISRRVFGTSGSQERRMGKTSFHDIVVKDAEAGVYRISFVAPDDVFLREIRTTSQHWMVGPRLYFGDVVGYATTTQAGRALTDSRHLVAETFHVEGTQSIQFGSGSFAVKKTHEPTRSDRAESGAARILAPNGDVRLIGDGLFALRDDAFFVPRPRRWGDRTNPDLEKIDGVLTSYQRPEKLEEGWYRAHFSWPIDVSLERLRFVMSAPGIAARAGGVDVRNVELVYTRPAVNSEDWWHVLKAELINAWRRL